MTELNLPGAYEETIIKAMMMAKGVRAKLMQMDDRGGRAILYFHSSGYSVNGSTGNHCVGFPYEAMAFYDGYKGYIPKVEYNGDSAILTEARHVKERSLHKINEQIEYFQRILGEEE